MPQKWSFADSFAITEAMNYHKSGDSDGGSQPILVGEHLEEAIDDLLDQLDAPPIYRQTIKSQLNRDRFVVTELI